MNRAKIPACTEYMYMPRKGGNIFENDKEQIKERNSKELVKERNGTEKEPVRADASFAA